MVEIVKLDDHRVDPVLVELLEELVAKAKSGCMQSLVVIGYDNRDGALFLRHKAARHEMLGALMLQIRRIEDELLDTSRPNWEEDE